MKQIQELMTQGHADEQSPDYSVTQMSEDVEEFGAHAPTQKFQASEGCLVSLNTAHPESGNLKEYLSKAPYKVLKCVVLQHPGSQGCTAHGSLITRCVLFRGTLKVLLITRPGRRKDCREVFCSKSQGEEGLSGEGKGRQGLRRCLRGS